MTAIIDQRPTTNDQRPTTNDQIHVALAVYDPSGTYSQHAGVTITSIFENTKSKVTVHIIHDDTLTEDNKKKFIRTAEKYNQVIEFNDITGYTKQISDELAKISEFWTVGTLYRIFIPDALSDIDKIIYLDCDVLVNLDIAELWNIDLEDKSLAGVFDPLHYCKKSSIAAFRIKLVVGSISSYINAGVTVMNLKKIRKLGNFCNTSIDWLMKHAHFFLYPDQDALNAIFLNDIKIIDAKFNVFSHHINTSNEMQNKIIHLNSQTRKPWKSITGSLAERLYWKMYLRSAWGENTSPDEFIDIISEIALSSYYLHMHGRQCLNKVTSAVKNKLRSKLRFLDMAMLLLKDAYYKLKYKLTSPAHKHS